MRRRRWLAKKAARHAVAIGSWLSGSLFAREAIAGGPRIRALTYHRFADERDAFCVSPRAFEEQMRHLAERKLAISLAQLCRFVSGRETLPDGACLVTIDDGLMSTYSKALPTLQRYSIPAVAFVTAGLVGSELRHPEPYMGWREVCALVESGLFTIGSHAFTHRSLGPMARADAWREAQSSKERLEAELGVPVTSFAYPFGTRVDFGRFTARALADAGYEVAFHSMHGVIRSGMDPISLPRVKVEGGEGLFMFGLLRRGAMDGWRVIDHTLWRVQRERLEVVGEQAPGEDAASIARMGGLG